MDQAQQFGVTRWVGCKERVVLRQGGNAEGAHPPFAAVLQGEQLRVVVKNAASLADEIANLGESALACAFGGQGRSLGKGYSGHSTVAQRATPCTSANWATSSVTKAGLFFAQLRRSATLASVPADSSSAAKRNKTLRFGNFEADLDARELRKNGRRLRLQEQPFAVLLTLLERPGEVVTREELRQRLWPADTFVDFDHSLNTAVNKLREVLGDSASTPHFIETLARRGYRFVGAVDSAAKAPAVETTVAQSDASVHDDLPKAHRGLTRTLFALIQIMYLSFYAAALLRWEAVSRIEWLLDVSVPVILIAVLVTAAVGVPLRLYLLSAVSFDYARLGVKFKRIFLPILVLDQLWAVAPFLILQKIGFGAALGSTAALLYVPFAERTLVRMAYRYAEK